jgi:hypothetical protein
VLILFGFSGLWVQPLRKATILLSGKAPQPAKYLAAKAGISQVLPRRVALASTIRSAIDNACRVAANVAGCFATLTIPICGNFVRSKAASATVQSRYIKNGELSRESKSIMRDFGDVIKCTVTVIRSLLNCIICSCLSNIWNM